MNKKMLVLIILIVGLGIYIYFSFVKNVSISPNIMVVNNSIINSDINSENIPATTSQPIIIEPIENALSRVTKKPFGLKVSPENSPVSPERFSGYHTGVDFETWPNEQDSDVSVYAICSGPLVLKRLASGYGGVVAQNCVINEADVVVVYGHLRLDSISVKINEELKSGQAIGILGKGYSSETDNERKHLHLSIHLGKSVNLKGYVQNQVELKSWVDVLTLLK